MSSVIVDRIGNFTVVPNAFIDNADLSHEAVRLFLLLRRLSNGQDDVPIAFPSYDTIKARTGIKGYATIAKALRELESAGWMMRRKRFGKSTIYTLTTPSRREGIDSPSFGEGLHEMKSSPSRGEGSVLHGVKSNKKYRDQETETKKQGEGAARRTRPTIDAPPALKNQPAPGKRGAVLPGEIVQPDPAVAMYAALTQYEPTKLQADDITRTCTDLTLWEKVIRDRDGFGCSHRNVKAALDDYRAGGVRDYRAERAARSNGNAGKASDTIHDKLARAAAMAGFGGEHVPDHYEAAQAVADAGGF